MPFKDANFSKVIGSGDKNQQIMMEKLNTLRTKEIFMYSTPTLQLFSLFETKVSISDKHIIA